MAQPPDITELVTQGVAIVVATRDGELRPAIGRGWGPALDAGATELTLSIGIDDGTTMVDNLRGGSPLAVTLSRPSNYSSVQLKGRVVELREPTDEDLQRVSAHTERFAREVEQLGLAGEPARALAPATFLTARLLIDERFDQTPGLGAGERL